MPIIAIYSNGESLPITERPRDKYAVFVGEEMAERSYTVQSLNIRTNKLETSRFTDRDVALHNARVLSDDVIITWKL